MIRSISFYIYDHNFDEYWKFLYRRFNYALCYLCLSLASIVYTREANFTKKESIQDVANENFSAPRNVVSKGQTTDTISLKWKTPARCFQEIGHYQIHYREEGAKTRFIIEATETNINKHTVGHLTGDTEYQFKVRAMTDDGGEGIYSEIINATTNISLANELMRTMLDLEISNRIHITHPKVYKLPVTEDLHQRDEIVKTRKCNFGMILLCIIECSIRNVGRDRFRYSVHWENKPIQLQTYMNVPFFDRKPDIVA